MNARVASGIIAICTLWFISPAALCAQRVDWTDVIADASAAVVTIQVYDDSERMVSTGTGFFVDSEGTLITNWHVMEGAVRAEVQLDEGRVFPVTEVLAESERHDLIKVRVDLGSYPAPALRFASTPPKAGQPVLVIGSPWGLDHTVSDGMVSALRLHEDLGSVIQFTAPVSPGSSGSPLLDEKGEVLGVVTVQIAEGQALNFAVAGATAVLLPNRAPIRLALWGRQKRQSSETVRAPVATPQRHSFTGRRVRVSTSVGRGEEVVGTFGLIGADAFSMTDELGLRRVIQYDSVRALRVWNGYSSAEAWIGAILVGAAATWAGYRYALSREECANPPEYPDPTAYTCDEVKAQATVGGALLGAGVGGLLGAALRREVWVEVPLSRVLGLVH